MLAYVSAFLCGFAVLTILMVVQVHSNEQLLEYLEMKALRLGGVMENPPLQRVKRDATNHHTNHNVPSPVVVPAVHFTLDEECILGANKGINTSAGLIIYGNQLCWKANAWNGTSQSRKLIVNQTGHVTVKKTGTYIIYAQIMFHGAEVKVGYGIHVNNDPMPFVESYEYNPTKQDEPRRSTYRLVNMMTTIFLRKKDVVSLSLPTQFNITIVKENTLTFWGIARLGTV